MSGIKDIQTGDTERFALLPYSQLVFDMMRAEPKVYWFSYSLRLDPLSAERLAQALQQVLRKHAVFSMEVDDDGMQHLVPKQDIFHGQYHSFDFIEEGGKVVLQVAYNRILFDGLSGIILAEDVLRAYRGGAIETDGYVDYLRATEENKQTERYARSKQWLESEFGGIKGEMVHPKTDTPIVGAFIAQEGVLTEDYTDLSEQMSRLAHEQLVSAMGLFSLCAALAIMSYNAQDEAALTWAYDGRESEAERHIVGSLHRDIPLKININNYCSTAEQNTMIAALSEQAIRSERLKLFKQLRRQMREGIVHSNYPYTLTRPNTQVWNYAVNVLVRPTMSDVSEVVPFDFELIEPTNAEPAKAYSLLDIELYDESCFTVVYRYSATHYKEESIRKYAALVRQYAEWLLTD